MNVFTAIKAQAGKVKDNALEIYAGIFVFFGIPAVVWVFLDWKVALAVFVGINSLVGLLAVVSTIRNGQ